MKLKYWIQAARPKTLPLAVSGILLGSAAAFLNHQWNPTVLFWGLLTAVLLQILSNFANDYGDFVKGTDQKAGRPDRMLASGKISKKGMLYALIFVSLLTLSSGLLLLYFSELSSDRIFTVFLIAGLASIAAALMYTMGKFAFAYTGMGDVFVLIFFGFVSVCGIYYLHSGQIAPEAWLCGLGAGLLSAGVLNVNNIRDCDSDKNNSKKTIPVRFGKNMALRYHRFLCLTGCLSIAGGFVYHIQLEAMEISPLEYLMVLAVFSPVFVNISAHVATIVRLVQSGTESPETDRALFNKELKNLSLSVLTLSFIWWLLAWFYI